MCDHMILGIYTQLPSVHTVAKLLQCEKRIIEEQINTFLLRSSMSYTKQFRYLPYFTPKKCTL
jgi:hypothetical protein